MPAVQHLPGSRDELLALKADIAQRIAAVQPQMSYLGAIREALPDDGYFVDEITQVGYASWYGFPVYEPRHHVSTGYQGTLGYGYATALGVKKAAMAAADLVARSTGYVLGGVSPLAQKNSLPTIIDETAELWDTIYVSAGRRGLQVELAPNDLAAVVSARFADIAR